MRRINKLYSRRTASLTDAERRMLGLLRLHDLVQAGLTS